MDAGTERRGIREARADLAALVRRAGRGDRIVITVDGRPVAQLGPLDPEPAVTIDQLLAAGLVEAPRRPDRPPSPDVAHLPVDVRADQLIDEVRGR